MNEPKKIYLNVGFDKDEIDLSNEDFEKLIGISWSDTRINDQDIEYIISERKQSTTANEQHDSKALSIANVVKSFTAEDVVNELKENETLDDAISYFDNLK